MKTLQHIAMVLVLALFCCSFAAQAEDDHDLLGRWEGKSMYGGEVGYEFKKDGVVIILSKGLPQPNTTATWKVDDDKEPNEININTKEGEIDFNFIAIYEVSEDGKKMKIAWGNKDAKKRPTKWDDADNFLVQLDKK